jgi:hypothetical protein
LCIGTARIVILNFLNTDSVLSTVLKTFHDSGIISPIAQTRKLRFREAKPLSQAQAFRMHQRQISTGLGFCRAHMVYSQLYKDMDGALVPKET